MPGTLGLSGAALGAPAVQRCGLIDPVLHEAAPAVRWRRGRQCCHGHLYLIDKMTSSLCHSSISRESFKDGKNEVAMFKFNL